MAKKAPAYSTTHGGSAPPWVEREVGASVQREVVDAIRRRARGRRFGSVGFTVRQFSTVVVWHDREPVGSVTFTPQPRPRFWTLRRIPWNAQQGYAESDVWQAIEALAGITVAALLSG